jgi:hypothetical protein
MVEFDLLSSLLVVRELVVVRSSRSMSADFLGMAVDTLEEREASVGLPFALLEGEVRDAIRRTEGGIESEEEVNEGDVLKRLRDGRRLGRSEDEVGGFDERESSLRKKEGSSTAVTQLYKKSRTVREIS